MPHRKPSWFHFWSTALTLVVFITMKKKMSGEYQVPISIYFKRTFTSARAIKKRKGIWQIVIYTITVPFEFIFIQ